MQNSLSIQNLLYVMRPLRYSINVMGAVALRHEPGLAK